jgi:hypothetical protein
MKKPIKILLIISILILSISLYFIGKFFLKLFGLHVDALSMIIGAWIFGLLLVINTFAMIYGIIKLIKYIKYNIKIKKISDLIFDEIKKEEFIKNPDYEYKDIWKPDQEVEVYESSSYTIPGYYMYSEISFSSLDKKINSSMEKFGFNQENYSNDLKWLTYNKVLKYLKLERFVDVERDEKDKIIKMSTHKF